jgi:hypothetical protein
VRPDGSWFVDTECQWFIADLCIDLDRQLRASKHRGRGSDEWGTKQRATAMSRIPSAAVVTASCSFSLRDGKWPASGSTATHGLRLDAGSARARVRLVVDRYLDGVSPRSRNRFPASLLCSFSAGLGETPSAIALEEERRSGCLADGDGVLWGASRCDGGVVVAVAGTPIPRPLQGQHCRAVP